MTTVLNKPVVMEINSMEDAVEIANEIERIDATSRAMKAELRKFVKEHGAVDTGLAVWDFRPSESWRFSPHGLREMAGLMVIEGHNPWEVLGVTKSNIDKLNWTDETLEKYGTKRVTQRFTSRKK